MSRTCTICGHEQRHDIEVALIGRDSYRTVARRFSVSTQLLPDGVHHGQGDTATSSSLASTLRSCSHLTRPITRSDVNAALC